MLYIGQETSIQVSGQRYTLQRYTRRLAKELARWVSKRLGSPLEALQGNLEGFPFAVADALIDHAKQLTRESQSIYSERFWHVWQSLPGKVFELSLLLRLYHPEADAESIFIESAWEHGEDYLANAVVSCIGRMPVDDGDVERGLLEEWGLLAPSVKPVNQRVDWLEIDKVLLKAYNLKPAELDNMTITEIMVLVEAYRQEQEAQSKKESHFDYVRLEQVKAWAAAQKKLTLEQRLQIAIRQCA